MVKEIVRPVPYLQQPRFQSKLMKYTVTVQRIREIVVEAKTRGRADTLIKRRMEPGEMVVGIKTSQI